jgi:Asp-tRNA(Asn)/Glu-tRNA(Gln) amidotransferase A subunit family amidase
MSFECNNYLWGRSINVWNKERCVGGSSGGEAGLIAAECSPLGIGTDVGGSLRIPA